MWKQQLFINGVGAACAGSGQARVTAQLKVRLGTGVTSVNVCFVFCHDSHLHVVCSDGQSCSCYSPSVFSFFSVPIMHISISSHCVSKYVFAFVICTLLQVLCSSHRCSF